MHNFLYFQIEQSLMNDLLEAADTLELKGLSQIRKNTAMNKFLPSFNGNQANVSTTNNVMTLTPSSTNTSDNSRIGLEATSSCGTSQQHVQISKNASQSNITCSSALLFDDTTGENNLQRSDKMQHHSGGQGIDITGSEQQQESYSSLSRANETVLEQQSYLSCSTIGSGSSAAPLNSHQQVNIEHTAHHSNYAPSSGICFTQSPTATYYSRASAIAAVMQQQQQQLPPPNQQQNFGNHTSQATSQIYSNNAACNSTLKRDFESRMTFSRVSGLLDYPHHSLHQHSVDDFRTAQNHVGPNKMTQQTLSTNNNNKATTATLNSIDQNQLTYHSHLDQQHLQQALHSSSGTQHCVQHQLQEQQEQEHRQHFSQYLQSGGGGAGTYSSSSNTTNSQIIAMPQHQTQQQQPAPSTPQQQQQNSIFSFECSTPVVAVAAGSSFSAGSSRVSGGSGVANARESSNASTIGEIETTLRAVGGSNSHINYQTAGIDLSLTKSEPSSPRDYTASAASEASNKRKRVSISELICQQLSH